MFCVGKYKMWTTDTINTAKSSYIFYTLTLRKSNCLFLGYISLLLLIFLCHILINFQCFLFPENSDTDLSSYVRVVHAGNMFDVICSIHAQQLKHSGYKKVMDFVKRNYYGISRSVIQKFTSLCPTCQRSAPQTSRPPLRPIIADGFLHRIQVDLIDMRNCPDTEFKYICHMMDHFSKFHVLFPLKTKSADEVATGMEERFLSYFGVPKIFHSDNGREFVNSIVTELFERWGGNVCLIRGRPRHSQSQGLVERGNQTVEKKIGAMKVDEGFGEATQYPWASWLPKIMHSLNTQECETTKTTPYAVVYGQEPHTLASMTKGIFNEEDIIQPSTSNTTESKSQSESQESPQPPPSPVSPRPIPDKHPAATKPQHPPKPAPRPPPKQASHPPPKPAPRPTPKPAPCPTPKPAPRPPKQASHPPPKPAPRPTPKPAPRPTPKPAPRPTAKPAPRPTAKPAPRPTKPVPCTVSPKHKEQSSPLSVPKPTHLEDNCSTEQLNNLNEHCTTEQTPATIEDTSTHDEQSTPPNAQQSATKSTTQQRNDTIKHSTHQQQTTEQATTHNQQDTFSSDNEHPSPPQAQQSQLKSDPQHEPETHQFYRQKASQHIVRNAQRMSAYYNKKCKTPQFSLNQYVTIQIPKNERSATDFPRLPCKIIQQSGNENVNYKLATKHGILKGVYRAGDLMPFSSKINPDLSRDITLREAALAENPSNQFIKKKCHCIGPCDNNKCSCKKNSIECSSHCHPGHTCKNITNTKPTKRFRKNNHPSTPSQFSIESSAYMLTDLEMAVASRLIKKTHPQIDGLQDTVLQTNKSWTLPTSQFIQFFHMSNPPHWLTLSNIGAAPDTVNLYDSSHLSIPSNILDDIASFVHTPNSKLTINHVNTQVQLNGTDCGVFAIAYAVSLANGEDPCNLQYTDMRKHLASCYDTHSLVPFPSSVQPRRRKFIRKYQIKVYCHC